VTIYGCGVSRQNGRIRFVVNISPGVQGENPPISGGSRMKRPRMRKAAVSHYLWVGKVADGASCRCEYWICSRCPLLSIDTAVIRCCERCHFKGVVEDQACVWCFQIYLGWWFPSHIAPKKMLYNCSRGSSAAKWCKTASHQHTDVSKQIGVPLHRYGIHIIHRMPNFLFQALYPLVI